ncbi:MAG: glycosyltransferase family 4 protein [Mucilaginibacter polytrichastri]|nr:glycosyltransferase family 4 protein [Mucilaginibacter polytrichastri]
MKRLAIITTHPIQYYAPVFKLLQERGNIGIHVFYTWSQAAYKKFDPGFDKEISWDIPLLEGYDFSWVSNTAKNPGSHHFNGIKNPGLLSAIRSYGADAILVFGWAYQSHLRALRHFHGRIPVFFRGDSTLLDRSSILKSALRKIWLTWVYRHVDTVFYVGENSRNYFKSFGLKDHQLIRASHAVDNIRFSADHSAEAEKIRGEKGIPASDTVVLFAGKFEPKKNPELLLACFLRLSLKNTHLIFAGNGILKPRLRELAAQQTKHVHFLPFQNQGRMPALYQASDLFCLPSGGPAETWGLAVNEAMACSKAVLASDKVGAAADLVHPGENGDIFRSGDTADLTKKLENLLSDTAKLKKMGLAGRRIISSFTFTRIAEAIEKRMNNEQ